jgi:hypothetical protein
MSMAILVSCLGVLLSASAAGDEATRSFSYSPAPRWDGEPESDLVCKAVKKECPIVWKKKQEEFQIGYELLYDVSGTVSGMRITRSSDCKPVDEYYQMFKRSMLFSPKLEDIRVELAEGVKPQDIRIIKSDSTNFSFNCAR